MTKDELIARQAQQIEELKDENARQKARIVNAVSRIVCIGGPLNDNKRQYSPDQLREWQSVLGELES